jgi:hypothetical protein
MGVHETMLAGVEMRESERKAHSTRHEAEYSFHRASGRASDYLPETE